MEITASSWQTIRGVFRDGFAAGFHFAVATVDDDGFPHVTPIGSVVLGDVGRAIYTERYAVGLGRRLERDPRLCVMALNSGKLELLKALWRGEARRPFGVRLYGTAGARREATPDELEGFSRRVRSLRFLRGHGLLWGDLRMVREVRFHAFEPVRLPPLGDPWPGGE
jgi:predicted pyridoxine 5'-phosphate oxidase superfamily flavin-nucleotide-binding protein